MLEPFTECCVLQGNRWPSFAKNALAGAEVDENTLDTHVITWLNQFFGKHESDLDRADPVWAHVNSAFRPISAAIKIIETMQPRHLNHDTGSRDLGGQRLFFFQRKGTGQASAG